jgi:phage gp16-like protein
MNNDTNKIMGIGMVRNHPILNKFFVYENGNYNRYVYIGKNRISREDMSGEEEQIMQAFDILCFKGNRHMKRGQGLKSFPVDMLYRVSKKIDLVNFIGNMFKIRLVHKNT